MRGVALRKVIGFGTLLMGALVVCVSIWLSFERNLDLPWTSIRLAPAFALIGGYPLYSMPETAPWVLVAYGPLFPVLYLPSTLAQDPSPAVGIATLLAHFYVLAPAALVCVSFMRRLRERETAIWFHWSALLLFFALVAFVSPALKYVLTSVHADAPAFGFFLLAVFFLFKAGAEPRAAVLVGVCVGLSAACKMNLGVAILAFAFWIFRDAGAKRAAICIVSAALAFAFVYGLAAWRDGWAPLLLNLRLPAAMPWIAVQEIDGLAPSGISHTLTAKLRTMLALGSSYLSDYGIVTLAILVLLPQMELRAPQATRMVKFFLLAALIMSLASMASVGKSGGDVNSRALVTLPLTLAAIFAGAIMLAVANRQTWLVGYGAFVAALFLTASATVVGLRQFSAGKLPTLLESFTTISAEPGRWYFPFDPLAHMLAEKKFRPNIDVIHSYAAAGFPVEEKAFRAAMPEDLEYIALPPAIASWGLAEIRRLLPEFNRTVEKSQLEHHQLLVR